MCRRNTFLTLVLAVGNLTILPAQEVTPNLEMRIGQTLLNVTKGRPLDYAPDPERIDDFRNQGNSSVGKEWAYKDQVFLRTEDRNADVYYGITILPEGYTPDPVKEKRFLDAAKHSHAPTGAQVAFLENKSGAVRRYRVFYRLVVGNVRLIFHITRIGDEAVNDALKLSHTQFEQFHRFATHQNLLESVGPPILVLSELTGEHVADGEVIQAPYNDGDELVTRFVLSPNEALIEADKPYTLFFQLDSNSDAEFQTTSGEAIKDTDGDGWGELQVPADTRKVPVRLKMKKIGRRNNRNSGQSLSAGSVFAAGRFRLIDRTTSIGVQRRPWHAVVQRLEVIPRAFEPAEQMTPDDDAQNPDLDGRLGFNDILEMGNALARNYETHRRTYFDTRDAIGAADSVCLGWHRDPRRTKSTDFFVLSDSQDNPGLISIPIRRPLTFMYDLKIFQEPKSERIPARVGSDENAAFNFGGSFGTETVDGLQVERELRRKIAVQEFQITLTKITETPIGESLAEFQAELPTRLRLTPDRNAEPVVVMGLQSGKRWVRDYFPLIGRYLNPDTDPLNRKPIFRHYDNPQLGPFTAPGIYELRLQSKLKHEEESVAKEIDVALRFAVDPTSDFSVNHRLSWESKRMGLTPKKPKG